MLNTLCRSIYTAPVILLSSIFFLIESTNVVTVCSVDLCCKNPYWCLYNVRFILRQSHKLLYTTYSRTFDNTFKTKIGLYLSVEVLSPDLKIGVTFAIFSTVGKSPLLRQRLIKNVSRAAIYLVASLMRVVGISSSPADFELFNISPCSVSL